MSQAPNSQNLYYPRGNSTDIGIYGAVPKKNHSNAGSNNRMYRAPDSQNLRGNNTNIGAVPKNHSDAGSNNNANQFIPKYSNHAKLIQDHLNEAKVMKVAGNPRNTTYLWEEYNHYEEIEQIAEEKQKLILENIKSVSGGSKRKTRRIRR